MLRGRKQYVSFSPSESCVFIGIHSFCIRTNKRVFCFVFSFFLMFSIDPLPSRLVNWVSSFDQKDTDHARTLKSHMIFDSFEIMIPSDSLDSDSLDSSLFLDSLKIGDSLNHCDFFSYRVTAPLISLVSSVFIRSHAKQSGKTMCFIAEHAFLQRTNLVMFLPNGHLVLRMDKDTFECTGLTAVKVGLFYEAVLDCFEELSERVRFCLERMKNVTVLLGCVDEEGKQVHMCWPEDAVVERVEMQMSSVDWDMLKIPLFKKTDDNELDKLQKADMFLYAGLVAMRSKFVCFIACYFKQTLSS